MIPVAAVRAGLAQAIKAANVDGLERVYEVETTNGDLPVVPAAVIGMPAWTPGPTGCFDQLEVPVAVVVARPATNDEAAIRKLDLLWPAVLEALLVGLAGRLGGIIVEGHLDRAEFGSFQTIGGTFPLPCQNITLTIHG